MSPVNPSTRGFERLRPHGGLPITPAMGGRHRRSRIADDAGFALIEALVGAVVLIVIAVATLGAIDRAQKTSGFGKNRSVAAALAEQDQARLRGLPSDSLSTYATNHAPARTVTINGLNYAVASTVDWIRDSTGGTLSCTNNSSQADYLKVTSTVSANSIQPVKISSLSSPPLAYSATRGTLVVQVNDGAVPAVGVSGVSVTIGGPTSATGTTNALGCAVFSFIPAGNYNVSIFKSGYVDYAGTTTALTGSKTVTGGNLTTLPFVYDSAGSIPVNFETDIGTSSTVVTRSRGYGASAVNPGVTGGRSSPSDTNPPVPTITLGTLFPFRDAYNTYSGRCAAANPTNFVSGWFNTGGLGANDAVIVPVGGTSSAVIVRQPALRARVTNNGSPQNNATVVVTPPSTGCSPKDIQWTTAKNPADNSDGWITKQAYDFGGSIGNVTYDPGVPFGTYSVCASYNFGTSGSPEWRSITKTVSAQSASPAAASTAVAMPLPTSGGSSIQPCT
jgi:Tfp pilus assembly protein PilV